MNKDVQYMKRALELAENGAGRVSPNPMVGAVIVKSGEIVGEGWHEAYGMPHAEKNAISNAGKNNCAGAAMYVTLEPCTHFGKTPPCADAIIESGIETVVVASSDPNPDVTGGGIGKLRAAGITVRTGVMEKEALSLNAPFFKWVSTKLPLVTAKWAMTLDGKIASRTGDSQWISNEKAREYTHILRGRSDAILVGAGTVIKDNPMLTCRTGGMPSPKRIIVDTTLSTPLDSTVVKTAGDVKTIIATTSSADVIKRKRIESAGCETIICPQTESGVDLSFLMKKLGEQKIQSVLVEGGARILGSLFDSALVDRVAVFVAPKIIGGKDALSPVLGTGREKLRDAFEISGIHYRNFDDDILLEGNLEKI